MLGDEQDEQTAPDEQLKIPKIIVRLENNNVMITGDLPPRHIAIGMLMTAIHAVNTFYDRQKTMIDARIQKPSLREIIANMKDN